ncbi:flagellar biosynthesis protein FliQ [Atopococcus tabaci]|uniref:flagellar biosynthesis protein FliQ n=1 Tax=Atopococcus tabaci TaxID=269774 RepID=UPI0003FC77EC|nr:flagellar biosynthesis protein FliQ [Atopococcus tabaci]
MTLAEVLDVLQEAFLVMLKVGGPILIIALVVGLLISILQATTQIQEQTLSFVPKLLAILGALVLLGNFMMNTLIEFTEHIFQLIAGM